MDAFSRKVVGWALADHLQASLPLEALDKAIASRGGSLKDLIHHSDRGVQYACRDYALRLHQIGAHASMSRPGTPQDNAKAESFMHTLKAEEVDGKAYRSREDAESKIGAFILNAAVGAEFSFRLRAPSILGCVSLVSDAEERARDGL
jgi:transposase InsO family protein